jgi:hypothetical protein
VDQRAAKDRKTAGTVAKGPSIRSQQTFTGARISQRQSSGVNECRDGRKPTGEPWCCECVWSGMGAQRGGRRERGVCRWEKQRAASERCSKARTELRLCSGVADRHGAGPAPTSRSPASVSVSVSTQRPKRAGKQASRQAGKLPWPASTSAPTGPSCWVPSRQHRGKQPCGNTVSGSLGLALKVCAACALRCASTAASCRA